jgi:hypothetical protein
MIPTGLALGMHTDAVNRLFGRPGRTRGNVSEWRYEHQRGEFTQETLIDIEFESGIVNAATVWRTETN